MLCILIHGTFASEAEWVQESAGIGVAIRKRWPHARIVSFQWSGRNSHGARRQAGNELAAQIRQLGTEASDGITLIAHSHGGNVALYAMSDRAVQELVRGCVFLGTPFLEVRKREIHRILPLICGLFPIAAFVTAAFTVRWVMIPLFIMAELHLGFLIGIALAIPAVRRRVIDKPWDTWLEFVTQKLEREQVRFFEHVSPPLLTKPSLVVSSRTDEAHIWLRALNWGASIAFHPMPYIAAFVRQWPLVVAIALLAIGLDHYAGGQSGIIVAGFLWSAFILFASIPLFIGLQFLAVLLPILFRGHRLGFGWEGLLAVPVVSVSPVDRPRSNESVQMYEAPDAPNRKGLVHSFYYTNSAVADQIVTWLNSIVVQNKSPDEHLAPIDPRPKAEAPSLKASVLRRAMLELRRPKILARTVIICSALVGPFYAWYRETTPYMEEGYDKSKYVLDEDIVRSMSFSVSIAAKSSVEKTFAINRQIAHRHCHLIGTHEADISKVSLAIDFDDWVKITKEDIKSNPYLSQRMKAEFKPIDEHRMTNVYASPDGPKKVSFDRHLHLRKATTDYGTVNFRNSSGRKSAASVNFSIVCLKDR